jgi:hypothetical protein
MSWQLVGGIHPEELPPDDVDDVLAVEPEPDVPVDNDDRLEETDALEAELPVAEALDVTSRPSPGVGPALFSHHLYGLHVCPTRQSALSTH